MTWFPDLTPYRYLAAEPNTLAVGWLESTAPFTIGENDQEFVECLARICRRGVNRTRGLHICSLCPTPPAGQWPPEQNRVSSFAGDFIVGGAEIRVAGQDGIVYAAPDLVIHYVQTHRYKPPSAFISAVLNQCRKRAFAT